MQPRCSRERAETIGREDALGRSAPAPLLSAATGNLIFKKVQKLLGGNVELMVTGEAP